MASVSRVVAAPPDQVFAVLADGWSYSNWVTGTSHMRAVQGTWPEVGAKLFHAAGLWPVVTRDETVVRQVAHNARLELIAKGWPIGEARVVIELVPTTPAATEVRLAETPISGPGKWLHNPLTELLLTRRNVESLARLAAIVERRTVPAENK